MTARNAEALAVIAGRNIGAIAIELGDLLGRFPRFNIPTLAPNAPREMLTAYAALRDARDAMLKLENIAAAPRHTFAADDLEIIPPARTDPARQAPLVRYE